jgi:hypothetical protein
VPRLIATHTAPIAGKNQSPATEVYTPRTQTIKAALLEDTATDDELAAAFGVTRRTIRRWRLPYVQIGMTRHYLLRAARDKIMRKQCSGDPPPRGRGRPPNMATSQKK